MDENAKCPPPLHPSALAYHKAEVQRLRGPLHRRIARAVGKTARGTGRLVGFTLERGSQAIVVGGAVYLAGKHQGWW